MKIVLKMSTILLGASALVLFTQCSKNDTQVTPNTPSATAELKAGSGKPCTSCTPINQAVLSDAEKASLIYMYHEESLARDVYTYFAAKYPILPIFKNIAASESQHVNAVATLMNTYKITDDGTLDAKFSDLFASLTANGSTLHNALLVGIDIENLDITDLQAYIDSNTITHADILTVYKNLLSASRSHLASFTTLSLKY